MKEGFRMRVRCKNLDASQEQQRIFSTKKVL